jgi:predicted Fe-Mo cluster-binding NifX family protein
VRIAVPTNDGATLSEHFGRSAAFLVFEVESGQIKSQETRANLPHQFPPGGACGHQGEGRGEGHNHTAMVAVLAGCDIVLCGGMGRRAAEALKAAGISAVSVATSGPAAEIVAAYVAGALDPAPESLCGRNH